MKTFVKFIALLIALMTAFLFVLLLCRGCYNKADHVCDNLAKEVAIKVGGGVNRPFFLTARCNLHCI